MSPLNPNQVRLVLSTFSHVDSVFRAVDRLARPSSSPFASERPDLSADETRVLQSFIALARTRLLAALDRLGIPQPRQTLSARWTVETSLNSAGIALSELDAATLRGYGDVDTDAAGELSALVADLRAIVDRARRALHEHDAGGLASVLASIRGASGEVLRAVDRISRDSGLAEIRPLLAAAADRASSSTFDVGIFGRVSAGKSSLINALVGQDVLPVGATPVTAVPTRISRGAPRADVHFLDAQRREISLDVIAEFVTDARNPENQAGVRSIDVFVPTVPEGLRLLDTPGVGSLGTSGPALAFKWLPRCDLGVVLIAAGSAVARDDLALVSGLRQAGIGCVVLLSKGDLLAPREVDRAVMYVRQELTTALGGDPSMEVRVISTAPGGEASLGAFRTTVLAPLAQDYARSAREALAERLHSLLRATAIALTGRRGDAGDAVVQLHRSRIAAFDLLRREVDRIDAAGPRLLEDVASAVTSAWAERQDARTAARNALLHAAAASLGVIRHAIDEVRALAGTTGGDGRRIPPLFDPPVIDALPDLAPPLGHRVLGHAVARRKLQPIAAPLADALHRYSSRLYAWGTGALEELAEASWDTTAGVPHDQLPEALQRLDRLLDRGATDAGTASPAVPSDGAIPGG